LAACGRRAADRDFGPPALDVVNIHFDWEIPSTIGEPLTFILNVKRGTRTSSVRFHIDLAKLAGTDLERLRKLLATRPKGYRLTYEIAWLLGLSLEQQMPTLGALDRATRVCELLLSPIKFKHPRRNQ
jgi:hypothetical protein